MSEINGQVLGVLLVIGIFGIVAGAITAVVTNLSNAIEERTTETIDSTQFSIKDLNSKQEILITFVK